MSTTETNTVTTPYHSRCIQLGTTIAFLRTIPHGASASAIRGVWDYRQHGLTVDQARGWIDTVRTARHSPRTGYRANGTTPVGAEGRIGALAADRARQRRAASERWTESAGQAVPLADIVVPTWDHSRHVYWIGDNLLVVTRSERAEWGRKNGKYPTHTEVSYLSEWITPETYLHPRQVVHDCRGDWLRRVLVDLGVATSEWQTGLRDVQLSPVYRVEIARRVGCVTIYRRTLAGATVDFAAKYRDTVFHAESPRASVRGLARKLMGCHAGTIREAINAQVAHERWGFCRAGLRQFAEATGLDVDGSYTLAEIRERVTDEVRSVYGTDLRTAGI